MTFEEELAVMEAEALNAMDNFFKYRPWFTRTSENQACTERLFEAAFKRGWDACKLQNLQKPHS